MPEKNYDIYAIESNPANFRPVKGQYKHPEILHFIWQSKTIPPYYVDNLLSASRRAQLAGYKVKLWVDNEKNIRKTLTLFPEMERLPNIEISNLASMDDIIDRHFTKDQAKKIKTMYAHELAGVAVNPAAISDIQRLLILLSEGGIYSDIDNQFEETQDDERFCGTVLMKEILFTVINWAHKVGENNIDIEKIFSNYFPSIYSVKDGAMMFDEDSQKAIDTMQTYSALLNSGESSDKVQLPNILSDYGYMYSHQHGNSFQSAVPASRIVKFILLEMCNAYEKSRVSQFKPYKGYAFFESSQLDRKRCPVENNAESRTEFFDSVLSTSGPTVLYNSLDKMAAKLGCQRRDFDMWNSMDQRNGTLPNVNSACSWMLYVTPDNDENLEQCSLFGHDEKSKLKGLKRRNAIIAKPRASVTTLNADEPARESRIQPLFTPEEVVEIEFAAARFNK